MIKLDALYGFFNRLSKKEKTYCYIAGVFLTLVLLDRLVIGPVHGKLRQLNQDMKATELKIVTSEHILSQKGRIIAETNKYASYFGAGEGEDQGISSFLKEIDLIANKSSLYIIDMKPGGLKEDKGNVKKYFISVSCEGQMEQVMDFMYNVESSRMLLSIEKYQINPKSKESSVAQCTMSVSRMNIL